jgi:hypothetical protein
MPNSQTKDFLFKSNKNYKLPKRHLKKWLKKVIKGSEMVQISYPVRYISRNPNKIAKEVKN